MANTTVQAQTEGVSARQSSREALKDSHSNSKQTFHRFLSFVIRTKACPSRVCDTCKTRARVLYHFVFNIIKSEAYETRIGVINNFESETVKIKERARNPSRNNPSRKEKEGWLMAVCPAERELMWERGTVGWMVFIAMKSVAQTRHRNRRRVRGETCAGWIGKARHRPGVGKKGTYADVAYRSLHLHSEPRVQPRGTFLTVRWKRYTVPVKSLEPLERLITEVRNHLCLYIYIYLCVCYGWSN